jgi:hypothetical protein
MVRKEGSLTVFTSALCIFALWHSVLLLVTLQCSLMLTTAFLDSQIHIATVHFALCTLEKFWLENMLGS